MSLSPSNLISASAEPQMLNRKSVSKWKVLINSVGNKSVRKQLSLYWPVPSAKSASHWTLPARTVVHTDKNGRPHHPENMPRTEQLSSVSVLSHIWHRLYADSHAHITKTHKSQHPRAHIDADEMLLLPIPHSPRITKTITVSACWHGFFFPGIFVFSIHRLEAHSTQPANAGTDTGQLYSYQSCVFVLCLTGRCHEAVSSLSFPFKPGTYKWGFQMEEQATYHEITTVLTSWMHCRSVQCWWTKRSKFNVSNSVHIKILERALKPGAGWWHLNF